MRVVQWEDGEITPSFVEAMSTCVQCRGCEPACPSGVPFGKLMEGTRAVLADEGHITPRWQRWGFAVLARHRMLLVGSWLLALAQRAHLVPRRISLGRLPLRRGRLAPPTGDGAVIYTGCVMDAWMRGTHRSTATVLDAIGVTYRYPATSGCCGALHLHAGLVDEAADLARRTIASMPGDAPIVVNSAGCGAAMKEYGEHLGTDEARAFSRRVVDVNEFVAKYAHRLPVSERRPPVIVQDPCHLRHVQHQEQHVRSILGRVAEVVELDDDGLCCGAGGAYASLQPVLANAIRERKLDRIHGAATTAAGGAAPVVASANPGCGMHLAGFGFEVRHPIDIVASALEPADDDRANRR